MASQETYVNSLKTGMNIDTHPSELQPQEFSLMVNGNVQSADGSVAKVTNEPSNLLCSTFKEGYKVIGVLPVAPQNRTIFFLVNPTTGDSEIGYIKNTYFDDESDSMVYCAECNNALVESDPLEISVQYPLCNYVTIINAKCLNFSIDNPIRAQYSIGFDPNNNLADNSAFTIYFTDNLNPLRYINTNNIPYIPYIVDKNNCNTPIFTEELDCNKIMVNEPYGPPCVTSTDIVLGGSLKAGTYQFAVAYANDIGVVLSDYSIISNPVSISDLMHVITTNTDYVTGNAIKYKVSNLDSKLYNYINIAVLITVNNTTSPFLIGTFFINSDTYVSTYSGNAYDDEARLNIDDILRRRPLYNKAKGITKANDFLFFYGLEEQRQLNLQPVVNNLKLKWQSIEVDENFYANGINSANYTSYLRDEVYPFSIYFKLKGGYNTADFLLSNNDDAYYSINYQMEDVITNGGTAPLDVYTTITDGNEIKSTGCSGTTINQLWEVYNTAQEQGIADCNYIAGGSQTIDLFTYFTCTSPLYTNAPSGDVNGYVSGYVYFKVDEPSGAVVYYIPDNFPNQPPTAPNSHTDFFNEDGTPFTSCACDVPAGYETIADNYHFITLQEPKLNAVVNTYTQSIPVPMPYYPNPSGQPGPFGDSVTSVCPPGTAGCTDTNDFIPTNKDCGSAIQIGASTTGACAVNYATHQPNDYAYLARVVTPTQLYVPTGTCQSCQGFANCYTDNQVWYSFIATSTTHAIRIGFNGFEAAGPFPSAKISMELFENCLTSSSPIKCTAPGDVNSGLYMLAGDIANGDIGLTVGSTYYFRLFTPDPTLLTMYQLNNPGDAHWSFATVCVTTPSPIGSITKDIPGEYEFECTYKSLTTTPVKVPVDSGCLIQTYKYGDFAYWESSERYPNNPDIWGELCGKQIRHYKFPDNVVSPYMNKIYDPNDRLSSALPSQYSFKNKVYPIGIKLDIRDVKRILNAAVAQGLITDAEKQNIVGYGIKRGNRRNDKSIVAKGLLYDLFQSTALNSHGDPIKNDVGSQSYESIWYPSYNFNDLNSDPWLRQKKNGPNILHPYNNQGYKNARYTFHSPDTSYNKPYLGSSLKLDGIHYGVSRGEFTELKKHAPYILLTSGAYAFAEALAALQIILEAAQYASAAAPITIFGTSAPLVGFFIEFAINLAFGFVVNQGKYTANYVELFKSIGTPRNPAIYYTSVGNYNGFMSIPNGNYKKISMLDNALYLNPGNIQILDNNTSLRINNFLRESSVFVSLNAYNPTGNLLPNKAFQPIDYIINNGSLSVPLSGDNSKTIPYNNIKSLAPDQQNAGIYSNIGSYYGALYNYVPDQYGTIDQIEWLDTGFCGVIDWKDEDQRNDCETIFGGDTYLSKVALKKKMPMFIEDRVNYQPNTDVQYSLLGNVGFPTYYLDSVPVDPTGAQAFFNFTPPVFVPINQNDTVFFQRGYFPLYFYGIPYFICESEYNSNLRHGENYEEKNFYPNVGDIVDWTQQYKIPISYDNYFFYNIDYSKQNTENSYYTLRNDYKDSLSYIWNQHPNRAVYSQKGVPNWLNFSANDYYDFPLEDGALIALNGIEQDKVVARQTNSTKVFNAFITIETSLEQQQVTVGNMFATKPLEYYKSDLGFGGSTHQSFESTPFGHFYINTENPSVFQLGGNQLLDITRGREKTKVKSWFRENLPFNIIKDFPNVDIDNNFKGIGITTVWDNKLDRYIITKKDYRLLPKYKGLVDYVNGQFFLNNTGEVSGLIDLSDTRYFCDKSWTIAYNPAFGEWISFYDFEPNYYISHNTYFQSGVNYSTKDKHLGIWNHLQTNKSYQVFYGDLYPWIVEYATQDKLINSTLDYIEYQCEVLRYQDSLNYYAVQNKTIDKALVYNQYQTTGILNLTPTDKNDLSQMENYPAVNGYSTNILVTNIENNWRFNSIIDVAKESGNPLMVYTCNNPYKVPNNNAVNYTQYFLTKQLRNDYNQVRLMNTSDSLHKYILKFNFSNNTLSKT